MIENILLDSIQRVSGFVRKNEDKFIAHVRRESNLKQETAVKENKRNLAQAQRRRDEISGLIKKLYESYALEKIPERHFTELLTGYDAEQTTLDGEIEKIQAEIKTYDTDTVNVDKFIELVKRHTEFTKFSTTLLNEFIQKVIVHEAVKENGVRTQEVEVFFSFIGKIELPELKAPRKEPSQTIGSRNRKLRRFMTEEELAHEREIDHRHYARKVAAKKAAEQAERAAILQGTPYAV